jgi:heptosyltransferase III
MPARPTSRDSFALASRLWRRYDLAVSTQTGDRPSGFAWLAGRMSAGLVKSKGAPAALKRIALILIAPWSRKKGGIESTTC